MGELRPAVVFGDVHGQAKQLKKLIDKVRERFGQEVDIYSLGDLIDRGPDSKGVIQLCIDEGIIGQIGNHDQWLQDLVVGQKFDEFPLRKVMGGRQTISSYDVDIYSDGKNYFPDGRDYKDIGKELFNSIPDSHKEWIVGLPNYRSITVDGKLYWLIHAGLIDPTARSFKFSMDLKELYNDGEMMEYISRAQPDNFLWPSPNIKGAFGRPDNLYHFDNAIQIFGHRPVKKPVIKEHFIALDTGCGTCAPYTLSAVVLPSKEIIQVDHQESK